MHETATDGRAVIGLAEAVIHGLSRDLRRSRWQNPLEWQLCLTYLHRGIDGGGRAAHRSVLLAVHDGAVEHSDECLLSESTPSYSRHT
jgi:hypothetical protein